MSGTDIKSKKPIIIQLTHSSFCLELKIVIISYVCNFSYWKTIHYVILYNTNIYIFIFQNIGRSNEILF